MGAKFQAHPWPAPPSCEGRLVLDVGSVQTETSLPGGLPERGPAADPYRPKQVGTWVPLLPCLFEAGGVTFLIFKTGIKVDGSCKEAGPSSV